MSTPGRSALIMRRLKKQGGTYASTAAMLADLEETVAAGDNFAAALVHNGFATETAAYRYIASLEETK